MSFVQKNALTYTHTHTHTRRRNNFMTLTKEEKTLRRKCLGRAILIKKPRGENPIFEILKVELMSVF